MGHALLPAAACVPATRGLPVSIPGLWRGSDLARDRPGIATGFAELDRELPGGGWPAGALTEILHARAGMGEMRLLLPALGRLARAGSPVFLLEPPWLPYAPAFAGAGIPPERLIVVRPRRPADALWACEQVLKELADGALVAWPQALRAQDARRLQLAVEGKSVLAIFMRPPAAVSEVTPAALRIALEARTQADSQPLAVRILKRRGGVLARPIVLAPPSPLFTRPVAATPAFPHAVDRDSLPPVLPGLHAASA
jgi:hypothetical protein